MVLAEVLLKVPHAAPLQPEPDKLQVTPLLPGSFVTVAVKLCVPFTCTDAEVGATVTTGGSGGVTVTMALAETVGAATDVAFSVTVAGFGTADGAV